MNAHPTKLIEAFASQALKIFYARSVSDAITNSDYEGEIKDKSSILNVLTFGAIESKNYTGADLTADDLTESNAQLVTNQAKAFYFKVKNWNTFRSYIKNPENTILEQVANEIKKLVDVFVLSFYPDVAAGNRDGTDLVGSAQTPSAITVEVANTTGVVTASGAIFSAGMVGKGFKADGHDVWYRIKTYTDTTHIVIEDDRDDLTSAYTGGAISSGADFTVQANTAVTVTPSTIYERATVLGEILTDAEIPAENRWLVVPAPIGTLIKLSPEFIGIGSESGRQAIQNGKLSNDYAGFQIFEVPSNRVGGNKTTGFHVLGGHKSAICFAMGLTENEVEQQLIGNFGKAYKSLYVYGAKVPDERRKALVEGFWIPGKDA